MAAALQSFVFHRNPNPNSNLYGYRASPLISRLSCSSSFRFDTIQSRCMGSKKSSISERHFGTRLLSTDHQISRLAPLATSDEDPKHSDRELMIDELDIEANDSEEEWKQMLETLKDEAVKMQEISRKAYDLYTKKAMVKLKATSEKLLIQADKAKNNFSIVTKEIREDGKEFLSSAAKNSPDSVKDIVEVFSSATDELTELSDVRDFYLGIPYGSFLVIGGFLSFMLTGSIPAIRFGVILGSALLALSISSLKSWKTGQSPALFLKGQTAIAAIIFTRHWRLLSQEWSFPTSLMTLIRHEISVVPDNNMEVMVSSKVIDMMNTRRKKRGYPVMVTCRFKSLIACGAMLVFYVYRISKNGHSKGSSLGPDLKN